MERAQADVAAGIASSEEPSSVPRKPQPELRLLIAEDDRTLREGLRLALEGEGYHVRAVGSGLEAVEALRRSRFDIVITDLHLEPVTGLDVLEAATTADPPSPVIVMTGDASLENGLAVIRAGACDCLAKPFSAAQLRAMLVRAAGLAQRSAMRRETLVAEFERVFVERLVHDAGGNLERAARMARVDRATLDQLIQKHHITPRS
jgi:DNA-binding NtrC family response regulator